MKYFCFFFALLMTTGLCNAQSEMPFPEKEYLRKFCAKYTLVDQPNVLADTNLIAIWKMKEDVDEHNYFVMQRLDPYQFACTYMNRGGTNRTYENFGAYFSKIGNATFLTVNNYNFDTRKPEYFFAKVTDLDSRGWNMTLSLVADTTLKDITSRKALRERLEKNIDNPNYYKAPVHFKKKLPLMYCK